MLFIIKFILFELYVFEVPLIDSNIEHNGINSINNDDGYLPLCLEIEIDNFVNPICIRIVRNSETYIGNLENNVHNLFTSF